MSVWVGLDGWRSTYSNYGTPGGDVLQAGTESDVHCSNGPAAPAQAYYWIEWDGTGNIPVTKKHLAHLPVNPGDDVVVSITVDTQGPNAWQYATAYFKDKTTGKSDTTRFPSGCLTIPAGKHAGDCIVLSNGQTIPATLYGNTAEWVAEIDFGNTYTLANFGMTQMLNVQATDSTGNVYTPTNPGALQQEIDWMTVGGTALPGDTLLACGYLVNGNVVLERARYNVVAPHNIGTNVPSPKPTNCAGTVEPPLH